MVNAVMAGTVEFATAADRAALGAYLARLLHFDKTAAVRFVGVGAVAAAYGGPPFGGVNVLSVRTVALADGSKPFDTTVSAGQLLDALTRAGETSPTALPTALLGGPAWAGLLPPRTGWTPAGQIAVSALAARVAEGNAEFRFRALGYGSPRDDARFGDGFGSGHGSDPGSGSDFGFGPGDGSHSGPEPASGSGSNPASGPGSGPEPVSRSSAPGSVSNSDHTSATSTGGSPRPVPTAGTGSASPSSAFTALAEDIWSRDVTTGLNLGSGSRGLSLRAAHAAHMLGFLGPEPLQDPTGQARLAVHTRWLRLDGPFGTVTERLRFDEN